MPPELRALSEALQQRIQEFEEAVADMEAKKAAANARTEQAAAQLSMVRQQLDRQTADLRRVQGRHAAELEEAGRKVSGVGGAGTLLSWRRRAGR